MIILCNTSLPNDMLQANPADIGKKNQTNTSNR